MQRIVIVDRYEVVRAGLRSILATQPNWDIVAEAEDGPEDCPPSDEGKT